LASCLTTGLELRARYEGYDNNLWGGAPVPDDSYLWLRAMRLSLENSGFSRLCRKAMEWLSDDTNHFHYSL
jgi:hypothetical protein